MNICKEAIFTSRFINSSIFIILCCFCLISLNQKEGYAQQANKEDVIIDDALINDYYQATITTPPDKLKLDPFYKKYTDAMGLPVISGGNVPDVALLIARDVVWW